MIEDIEKNSKKSLADKEIASLMKTLASKSYRENVSFPKKIIQPFKPISFFETANKNLQKNDGLINEPKEVSEKPEEYIESQNAEIENELSEKNKSIKENFDHIDTPPEDSEGKNDLIESETNTTNLEKQSTSNIGIPIKENLYTKDELNQEYQKGFSEGTEKEQKKYIEEKEILIKKFDKIINAIEEKIFIDTKLLEKHIKEEIIKITTERLGLLINEMPNEFLEKIKSLSNTIIKNSGKKILKLNPEDLKSIEQIINNEAFLEKFVFLSDQSLSRGDCIIEIGEISLEDKIIDRYGSNGESTRFFEIGNTENSNKEKPQPEQKTKKTDINSGTSSLSSVQEDESINTETPQLEQNIEQTQANIDTPDISTSMSENENLDKPIEITPNQDQEIDKKDQDNT